MHAPKYCTAVEPVEWTMRLCGKPYGTVLRQTRLYTVHVAFYGILSETAYNRDGFAVSVATTDTIMQLML